MTGGSGDGREEHQGGDPVCWLGQTCPECGAMPSEEHGDRCWRCGNRLPRASDD